MFKQALCYGLILMSMSVTACKTLNNDATTKDLAFSSQQGVKNIAATFIAPNPVGNSTAYITNDPAYLVEDLTSLEEGFTVYRDDAATSASVPARLTELSKSSYLSDEGTLFIYVGGHGAPQAMAQMSDGGFVNWDTIAAAVKRGRGGKPVKRMILMIFGCYSGSWIDGLQGRNTKDVAEQLVVMTSSTSGQYSYFNNVNSDLISAFHNAFAAAKANNAGITIGEFIQSIKNGVTSSHPQSYVYPQSVLQERLFNAEAVQMVSDAEAQGIMPSVEDFRARRLSPSTTTIRAKLGQTRDSERACSLASIKNPDGVYICAAWNKKDYDARAAVFAHTRAATDGTKYYCSQSLLYASLTAERYKALHEHCGGQLFQQ